MSIYDNFKKDESSTTKRNYVVFAIAVFILAIFIGYKIAETIL